MLCHIKTNVWIMSGWERALSKSCRSTLLPWFMSLPCLCWALQGGSKGAPAHLGDTRLWAESSSGVSGEWVNIFCPTQSQSRAGEQWAGNGHWSFSWQLLCVALLSARGWCSASPHGLNISSMFQQPCFSMGSVSSRWFAACPDVEAGSWCLEGFGKARAWWGWAGLWPGPTGGSSQSEKSKSGQPALVVFYSSAGSTAFSVPLPAQGTGIY